jgi:formate dehydrogenase subunit delta
MSLDAMSHEKSPDQLVMDKIVRMANQIATFFLSQPEDIRAEGVATHINKFWEPRMRRHLFEHLDGGGEGFLPLVIQASTLIRRPEAKVGSGVGVGEDAAKGAPGGKGPAAGESLSEPNIPESTA